MPDTRGLLARLARGKEAALAEPFAYVGNAIVAQVMFQWAAHEMLVALAIAGLLLLVWSMAPLFPTEEYGIVAACTLVLGYTVYLLTKLPRAAAWGLLWWRLRLAPRQLARLALYRIAIHWLAEADRLLARHRPGSVVGTILDMAGRWYSGPRDQVAYALAAAVEPLMWRHTIRAAAFALAPILVVIAAFRSVVTYGYLLHRAAHLGIVEAVAYPFAALIDAAAGTALRSALRGG